MNFLIFVSFPLHNIQIKRLELNWNKLIELIVIMISHTSKNWYILSRVFNLLIAEWFSQTGPFMHLINHAFRSQ